MEKLKIKHQRYNLEWGKYKSDKNKTKSLLKEEIRDILIYGSFTKDDLIQIKNFAKDKGFR